MDNWEQIEKLFHSALREPREMRNAFLNDACGGDGELLKAVESLLQRADDSMFLEGSPVSRLEAPRRTWEAGQTVGRFEIIELIGAGGMGEVYRAHDRSLKRYVAVKSLRMSIAMNADHLRRFEQEARVVGMLNHPNILAIYDIGMHDGSPYVVSELLQGETLRDRLRSGPIPLRRAVEFALQITRGLAAAHAKGVTHRDLKPDNLFLTEDGHVKILDFGLAKLSIPGSSQAGMNDETVSMTGAGVVMGTPGYMAPEQVTGQAAGPRADVFSFGVVLYEMLTGRRPFQGRTLTELMGATLKEDPPDISHLDPKIPAGLGRITLHCLEKRPEDRFESARDLGFALESLVAAEPATAPAAGPRPRRWMWMGGAAAAILVLSVLAVVVDRSLRTATPPKFDMLTFRRGPVWAARFGPGKSVLYSAAWDGGTQQVYSTLAGNRESRPLDVGIAQLAAVSSQGEVAVLMRPTPFSMPVVFGTLARVPLSGGTPRELREMVGSVDWSPSGDQMLISCRLKEGRGVRLEYPIGHVIYQKDGWIRFARLSPQGDAIAFLQYVPGATEFSTLMLFDLGSGKTIPLGDWSASSGLAWSPNGSEIWLTAGAGSISNELHAVTRSGKRRVVWRTMTGIALHDISRDGQLLLSEDTWKGMAYGILPGDQRERSLSWLDGTMAPHIAPDGRKLIFTEIGGGAGPAKSVFFRKSDGSPAVRLGDGYGSSLSPDGNWASATLNFPPPLRVMLLPTGAGEPREVVSDGIQFGGSRPFWLPASRSFVINGAEKGHPPRCYEMEVSELKAQPVTPFGWPCRSVSPDGKSVLTTNAKAKWRIYPIAGGEGTDVPDLPANSVPVQWSDDPRILYLRNEQQIYRFDCVTGQPRLWKELTPADPAGIIGYSGFSTTPDGKYYAYSFLRLLSDLYLVDGLK